MTTLVPPTKEVRHQFPSGHETWIQTEGAKKELITGCLTKLATFASVAFLTAGELEDGSRREPP